LTVAAVGIFLAVRHGRGWYHYAAARNALSCHEHAAALHHLAVCRAVWPGSAATFLHSARAARQANRLDEAEKHLDVCRTLGGPAEQAVLEDYLLQAQRGRLDGVAKKLQAFLQKEHADSVLILEVLTNEWMRTYRLDQALADIEKWLTLQPGSREALIRKGWVLEHMADLPGSVAAYQEALDADPERDRREQDRVRLRLAELLIKQNRPREADGHLQTLRARQPKNAVVLLALARCRFLQGDTDTANRVLDALLSEQPENGEALGERGRIALLTSGADRAEPWLRQAVKCSPRDKVIVGSFVGCLRRLRKLDEAKIYAARLQEIQDDEHAMAGLMREVMTAPEDPQLRYEVGRIFLRNGFSEDGRKWLGMALSHDPAHQPAHQALAEYFESIGNQEEAALHRRAVARIESHRAEMKKRLP